MLFSSEGFKGMLNELKSEGYLFHYDKVICDRVGNFSNLLTSGVKDDLLDLGVYDEYLELPISCIKLFFSNVDGDEKIIKLYSGKNSQLLMNLYSRHQREIEPIETMSFVFDETFTERTRDCTESFEVRLSEPFFVFCLEVGGFLFGNTSLYGVFGNDKFINSCESYGRYWFKGLNINMAYELISVLASMKIHYYDSIIYDTGTVMRYSDVDEHQFISVMVENGKLNVWYEDVYTDGSVVESMVSRYAKALSGYDTTRYVVNSTKNNGMLLYRKYRGLMINTDELNPKYLYSDIDINCLVDDLVMNGYVFTSHGGQEGSSIANSIYVYGMECADFTKNKYVYIGFYFDCGINDIVVELLFTDNECTTITMDSIDVTMIPVCTGSGGSQGDSVEVGKGLYSATA